MQSAINVTQSYISRRGTSGRDELLMHRGKISELKAFKKGAVLVSDNTGQTPTAYMADEVFASEDVSPELGFSRLTNS